ncbi:hypothetical protein BAE46_11810 [Glaciecola punicea]|uniref:hypothetical protein n=1 Tax=Glaciecola punicea TaxID=56804 RepID=UPI0008721BDA|nr:hypothetical protein [Glaciecola punicea]OFA30421.1 hypothetical protein BAE46_11810 [Glaciecola punicea]
MDSLVPRNSALTTLACFLILSTVLILVNVGSVSAQSFSQKLDVQLRADDRSSREIRYQYRVRYRPQISFNDTWSVNAFAVTGDEFGSSHNTLNDSSADHLYVRRVFGRHQGDYGKTEFGIIPTYKGRVSSSGLSKYGWIKGVRHVRAIGDNNLEIVVGQLTSLDPARALNAPDEFDYVEVEYSVQINDIWSYELSAERMKNENFLRTELRYQYNNNITLFGEVVGRLDSAKTKAVLGGEGEFSISEYSVEYFAHYSYVSENFGLRAELTEDFLGTGHGFSGELSGALASTQFDWFVRYDAVKDRTRLLAGLKWSL